MKPSSILRTSLFLCLFALSFESKAQEHCEYLFPPAKSRAEFNKNVSIHQIMEAMRAEFQEPTEHVKIRYAGNEKQYHDLDRPELVGKRIEVEFIDDRLTPGKDLEGHPVSQMVLTKGYLDSAGQELLPGLKAASLKGTKDLSKFREVGVWIIYTKSGTYKSDIITSDDPFMISNETNDQGFQRAYQKAVQVEGNGVVIDLVEVYHTHKVKGEALSPGDASFLKKSAHKVNEILSEKGVFAIYAIPIVGDVLFRRIVTKE